MHPSAALSATYYASPIGSDTGAGTEKDPISLSEGVSSFLKQNTANTLVLMRGTYHITSPIAMSGPQDANSVMELRGETGDPADVIIDAQHKCIPIRMNRNSLVTGVTVKNGMSTSSTLDSSADGIRIGAAVGGSGLSVVSNCVVTCCTNAFSRDAAYIGGAVSVFGNGLLVDSVVSNNTATCDSAGIVLYGGEARGCVITENVAAGLRRTCAYGGGVYVATNATATLTDCTISGNKAHGSGSTAGISGSLGGGVYVAANANALFSGCAITNNAASLDSARSTYGGGVYMAANAAATLTNCTISGNTAKQAGGLNAESGTTLKCIDCRFTGNKATSTHGGGVFLNTGAAAALTNCTVSANTAAKVGGGVFLNTSAEATLADCTISGNEAANSAAGVFVQASATATLTNCTVSANTANYGGGLEMRTGSTLKCTDCRFEGNKATYIGGGALVSGTCNAEISGSVFDGNEATTKSTATKNMPQTFGGALAVSNLVSDVSAASLVVSNCVFRNNSSAWRGGAFSGPWPGVVYADLVDCVFTNNSSLLRGGAVCVYDTDTTDTSTRFRMRNCLVARNKTTGTEADYGGGVYLHSYSDPVLESCTIVSNEMASAKGVGPGLAHEAKATGTAKNCIIAFNVANGQKESSENTYYRDASAYQYCCVWPELKSVFSPDNHCVNADPKFTDADAGDYTLASGSPCRDAGFYEDWMDGARDLAGKKRVSGSAVDIGCYEFFRQPGLAIIVR